MPDTGLRCGFCRRAGRRPCRRGSGTPRSTPCRAHGGASPARAGIVPISVGRRAVAIESCEFKAQAVSIRGRPTIQPATGPSKAPGPRHQGRFTLRNRFARVSPVRSDQSREGPGDGASRGCGGPGNGALGTTHPHDSGHFEGLLGGFGPRQGRFCPLRRCDFLFVDRTGWSKHSARKTPPRTCLRESPGRCS